MAQKRIVHLRVYRGKELNYDANGKVKNENNRVSITHDTVEWSNYMKHLPANGFCKVSVENASVLEGKDYKTAGYSDIAEEVRVAFEGQKEVITDPRDLRIAQLEKQMKEMIEASKPKEKATVKEKDVEVTVDSSKDVIAPKLPKGKTIDALGREKLEKIFPNIQDLEPANVTDFRTIIRETYPNKY